MKDKMTWLSIDAEKHLIKSSTHLWFKKKTHSANVVCFGMKGAFLDIIKVIYTKPTADIILNGQKVKTFSSRPEITEGCPLSPHLFNIVMEVVTTAIKEKEQMKGIQLEWKK